MSIRLINHLLCHIMRQTGAMPKLEANLLLEGADHDYSCLCDTCMEFWRLIGPDEDTGEYGPFGATIEREGGIDHE